ncbi:MAG: ABC transporter ATP-binding protein [Dehalococcoidia bacterium]|nr:MAG: ABC transporter ATP-binding protein [Dehalococcoidia bacterium]
MEAIRCEGLTKHYGAIAAVDGLNLVIEEGSIFGFLGPNGAGKTTTVRLLTGLSRPSRGKAWVMGEEVTPTSVSLRSKVGYLPEEPAFYNWMNGREFLIYVGELFHLPSRENKKRCDELLEFAGLSEAASRRIGGYSRGMRQRLGLAQALMNRPKVLFLDEPCSALDPIGRREVLDTILRLKEEATVFMSTHILADVERICDVVGIIDKGRLVIEERTEELRDRFAQPIFELHLEGEAHSITRLLQSLPWVAKVEEEHRDNEAVLHIRVSDVITAKRELPKIVAESGLILLHYELMSPSLEEVFIELVGTRGEE